MRLTANALAVVLVALMVVPALAERESGVSVEIVSIRASAPAGARGPAGKAIQIDPKLAGLGKKLSALFAYGRYTMVGRVSTHAVFDRVSTVELPERFILEIEPVARRGRGDRRIEMTITLVRDVRSTKDAPPPRSEDDIVLRTRLRLESGGTVLLGGPPIESGTLILAVSARD